MNIDDASLINLKVHQIQKFLTKVLIRAKQDQKQLMLNPNSFKSIIYDTYVNSLKEWRLFYSNSGNKVNPNPFFPVYDIDIKDYQKYHEFIMNFTEELIYHNMLKEKIVLRDAITYLKKTDLNKDDNYVLYNTLSKIYNQYQVYILNQVVLATYESKTYNDCIKSFKRLFQEGSYKGFAKYRLKGINKPDLVNYHTLLTENISKEEMIGVINRSLMRLNLNHEYQFVPNDGLFSEYVDTLIDCYRIQILDQITFISSQFQGLDETKKALNEYVSTQKVDSLIIGVENEKIVNKHLFCRYVKPNKLMGIIRGKLAIGNDSITNEELINQYVNLFDNTKFKIK